MNRMTDKFQRDVWPADTKERIEKMRADGCTWEEVAVSLGCSLSSIRKKAASLGLLLATKYVRYSAEDDAYIAEEWRRGMPVEVIAENLGRSCGSIRQRMFSNHKDLRGIRTTQGTIIVKKYGIDVLRLGKTPDEAAKFAREAVLSSKAKARVAAIEAKEARRRSIIDKMNEQIAAGIPRNDAIFEARASGLELERIATVVGITRERVRQIYDQTAFTRAMRETISAQAAE